MECSLPSAVLTIAGVIPGARLDVRLGQRPDGGGIERRAVDGKMRSVTGAIPARLEGIPVQVAAHMRAGGRARI